MTERDEVGEAAEASWEQTDVAQFDIELPNFLAGMHCGYKLGYRARVTEEAVAKVPYFRSIEPRTEPFPVNIVATRRAFEEGPFRCFGMCGKEVPEPMVCDECFARDNPDTVAEMAAIKDSHAIATAERLVVCAAVRRQMALSNRLAMQGSSSGMSAEQWVMDCDKDLARSVAQLLFVEGKERNP